MSSDYTPAQEQVADIFDRFQEHDKLYGKSVRDDKYIWRQVDSMTAESLFYLIYWAQQHPDYTCLLYTSPSPRDQRGSRMPSSA